MADSVRSFIPYEVPLNPDHLRDSARLVLPADLTQAEADRLCGFIQALALATPEILREEDGDDG
jgi:hypothetical protein